MGRSSLRSVSVLAGGNAAGQAITFASTLILAQIFSDHDYGRLAVIVSSGSMLGIAAHARFHLALGSDVRLSRAAAITRLALLSSLLVTSFAGIVLAALTLTAIIDLSAEAIIGICLVGLGTAMIEVLSYWRSYNGDHGFTAKTAIARAVSVPACQIALVSFGGDGLVAGFLIGTFMTVGLGLYHEFRSGKQLLLGWRRSASPVKVAAHFKSFPLFSLPQGFLVSATINSIPLFIGLFFNTAVVGQYWLAYRVSLAPIALIGSAYRQVFLTVSAEPGAPPLPKILRRHTVNGLTVIPFLAVIAFFTIPLVFKIAYGPDWALAGSFAQWLMITTAIDVGKIPAVVNFQTSGRLSTLLLVETIASAAKLSVLYLALATFTPVYGIAAYCLTSLASSLTLIAVSFGMPKAIFQRSDDRVKIERSR